MNTYIFMRSYLGNPRKSDCTNWVTVLTTLQYTCTLVLLDVRGLHPEAKSTWDDDVWMAKWGLGWGQVGGVKTRYSYADSGFFKYYMVYTGKNSHRTAYRIVQIETKSI